MHKVNVIVVLTLTLAAALAWAHAWYRSWFFSGGIVFSSFASVLACSLTFCACVGWAMVTFGRRHGGGETRCRKCGYILRGITEPRCSECGERI